MNKYDFRSLSDKVIDYMEGREVIGVKEWIPYFLSSVGSHVANLHNKGYTEFGHTFWAMGGRIVDCRLHLLVVAPPGYSKSYFITEFMDKGIGLMFGAIESVFVGRVTEKGLVGGYDGSGKWVSGYADSNPNSIIGAEEFASVLKAGKQDHSLTLEEQLLFILDQGRVNYKIGNFPPKEYTTYVTLWAGTQSERIGVTGAGLPSGLQRRVAFLNINPNEKDIDNYKDSYDKGQGIRPDYKKIEEIRKEFKMIDAEFRATDVVFDEDYRKWRQALPIPHHELIIADRIAVGWTIVNKYKGLDELQIYNEKEMCRLIDRSVRMRNEVLGGTTRSQIKRLMESRDWGLTELKTKLVHLGVTYKVSGDELDKLVGEGILVYKKKKSPKSRKPITYICKGSEWS